MSQTQGRSGGGSAPGIPGWVKVLGIIAILLVVLVVILHLTGHSLGGPGSHMPPASSSLYIAQLRSLVSWR